MAVPDWPNTYGYNLFLFPVSQWVGGILYEHTHRLMGALVGLLTAGLAVWLWVRETEGKTRHLGVAFMVLAVAMLGARSMPVYVGLAALALPVMAWTLFRFWKDRDAWRWLGVTALAAVILQGVLGGLRVAWMKDEIGVFHGMLAQSFLVLTGAIALLTTRWWQQQGSLAGPGQSGRLRGVIVLATTLVFVQLGLGATMRHRHAGLAVPDFPLAYGRVWPRIDGDAIQRYNQQRIEVVAANPITATDVVLHMTHRIGACLVLAAVALAFVESRRHLRTRHPVRRCSGVWLGLVGAQFLLGGITVWTNKAADVATAHVALGSLILLTGGLLCAVVWKRGAVDVASRASGDQYPMGSPEQLFPAAS